MKGKITQWNDEKGFGFIKSDSHNSNIFVHITCIDTRSRRPEVNDSVEFIITKDKDGRSRASRVKIEGLPVKSNIIVVEPLQKKGFDYVLVLVILGSIGYTSYELYVSNNIETTWFYGIPALISLFALNRPKVPKQESYCCAKCRSIEKFNPRTISAWRSGVTRFFCNKCHSEWLKNKSNVQASYTPRPSYRQRRGSRGCLGSLMFFIAMPIAVGVAIWDFLF